MSTITADKLVAAYIKIRNARSVLQQKFDAEDGDLKAQMKIVSDKLAEICKDTGANSINTPHGTVMRGVKTRYFPSDWGQMIDFIKEHDAIELLEQRIHQSNMKKFLEEHPDDYPIGLNHTSEYTITVRKR